MFAQRRAQEVELPARVTVVHMDPGAEYDQGAQSAKRISAPLPAMYSLDQKTFEVPLVLEPSEAKTLAHRILFGAWVERDSYEFALGSEHGALEPTDLVEITVDDADPVRVRLTRVEFGADFSLRLRGTRDVPSVYQIEAVADGGQGHRPRLVDRNPATELIALEMPLLRARDDVGRQAVRRYIAMAGFSQAWPGASLFKLGDGDDAFVDRRISGVTWGSVTLVPAAPRSPWVRQTDAVLEVALVSGAEDMASVSWLELFGGANAAALINPAGEVEVIQFREVELIGNQRVRLTGLLRGRRGTDPFVGLHGTGATFVLVDTALILTELPLDRIGETVRWRAVGSGQIAEEADIVSQEVRGVDLKPWSPTALRVQADAQDDLTLTWKRRTRFNGEWRNGTGTVPLNEGSEAYRLEVLDADGTIVRVIKMAVPETLYSRAQIIADFGALQPELRFRVYQLSEEVGPGFALDRVVAIDGNRPVNVTAPSLTKEF